MKNEYRENTIKDWTILIYAAGNNELAPEIWQSIQALTSIKSTENINVIIEVSSGDKQMVEIMRPTEEFYDKKDCWHGVKRFILNNGNLISISTTSGKNMADPRVLSDFIEWAVDYYPARHFLLILSGHGYQFAGALTDYSQDHPCIMGIPEMVHVLNKVGSNMMRKIDILILDICYFNYIEVLYQFAAVPDHSIENIITFVHDGPLAGLNYHDIINVLQKKCKDRNIEEITKDIIKKLKCNLVAIRLQHEKMKNIKKVINELAEDYLKKRSRDDINIIDFF